MKIRALFLLSTILTLGITTAYSKNVSQKDAEKVARNFYYETYNQYFGGISYQDISLGDVVVEKTGGEPAYYVFSLLPKGFIIVSAEDAFTPIIGYSTESNYDPANNANFRSFIRTYADQVEFARNNNVEADQATQSAWAHLSTDNLSELAAIDGARDVEPLLLAMWNQDYPYNAYCPTDAAGPGGHVYAGCVATAMSMVMYYYRYPLQGQGSHTYTCPGYGALTANFGETYYNWGEMLNSITASSGQSILPIAELQYHCGVAVNMGYGADASGAFSADVPGAIINYFNYSSLAQYNQKMSYTQTVWENMIQQSINDKKILYYSGQSTDGGHAFVLDGYQIASPSNLYHFNFGWSGYDNGYFTITNVNGFSSQQGMVRNFYPGENYPYGCANATLTGASGSFEDGSGPLAEYDANRNCTWLIHPSDSVQYMTLNFTAFDIAAGDTLYVYDGMDATAPLLGSFSGSSLPVSVTSTSNYLYVNFVSNETTSGSGFQAEYTSTFPVYCNGVTTLTDPEGTLSDGSDESNYNNKSICRWKIQPPNAVDIKLTFTKFETADETDFVEVYDLGTNVLMGTFSGNEIPDAITCASGKLYIVFKTGDFNTADGWEADWTIGNVGIKDNSVYNNFMVYPNPAKDNINVKFNIKDQQNITMQLLTSTGSIVYSENANNFKGYFYKSMDVSSFAKGVYTLRLVSDKGVVNKRIVID